MGKDEKGIVKYSGAKMHVTPITEKQSVILK